jgi:hypothetical protein
VGGVAVVRDLDAELDKGDGRRTQPGGEEDRQIAAAAVGREPAGQRDDVAVPTLPWA